MNYKTKQYKSKNSIEKATSGTITSFVRTKRGNISVYIDEKFAFAVSEDTFIDFHLKKNQYLDIDTAKQVLKTDIVNRVRNKAIERIAARPRSEREIFDYAKQKAYARCSDKELSMQIAANVVDKLLLKKYINDKDFATWWIEQRKFHKPRSKREIYAELSRKGVSRNIIENTLHEHFQEEDGMEALMTLADKKFNVLVNKKLEKVKLKEKLTAYLMRKGFQWKQITAYLKTKEL